MLQKPRVAERRRGSVTDERRAEPARRLFRVALARQHRAGDQQLPPGTRPGERGPELERELEELDPGAGGAGVADEEPGRLGGEHGLARPGGGTTIGSPQGGRRGSAAISARRRAGSVRPTRLTSRTPRRSVSISSGLSPASSRTPPG